MAIDIREAMPEDQADAEKVSVLAFQSVRAVYRPSAAAVANRKTLDRVLHSLVAVEGGTLIGTVKYYLVDTSICILALAVHPDHRRRGVARLLIQALRDKALSLDRPTLSLYTIRETGNVPVFGNLGFDVVTEQPSELFVSDLHEQLTEVHMTKRVIDHAQRAWL